MSNVETVHQRFLAQFIACYGVEINVETAQLYLRAAAVVLNTNNFCQRDDRAIHPGKEDQQKTLL